MSLQDRLERAEHDLLCAKMIDNFSRREREVARIEAIIAAIKREIVAQ